MTMPRWVIAGLFAVNAVLASGLLLHGLGDTPARGQVAATNASGGGLLVAGSMANNQPVLYVLDTASGRMVVFQPDALRRTTTVLGTVDVAQDMERTLGRR